MSANLDLVRSIYAATEHGDYSSAEWADPDIEYVVADGPEPATWKGLTEMARGMGQILGAWEEVRTKVDEYRELDDERVLVLLHHGGRGKSSGLELDALSTRGADIVYMRDGKVTKVVKYFDRDRALAELGLAPEADAAEATSPNVEIVRQVIQAFNRRAEDWVEYYDKEIEFHMPSNWPEDPTYRGHAGLRRAEALWAENFNEYHWDIESLIDAGDLVVGLFRTRGRIKDGGAWLEAPVGALFYLRDGKIVRALTYFSWADALAAAGVQE